MGYARMAAQARWMTGASRPAWDWRPVAAVDLFQMRATTAWTVSSRVEVPAVTPTRWHSGNHAGWRSSAVSTWWTAEPGEAGGFAELPGVIAVPAADDDDQIVFPAKPFHGGLAVFGGLADGVFEDDLALRDGAV